MNKKISSVEEYLAYLPEVTRAPLELFRHQLHDLIPGWEEIFSYGVPILRIRRKHVVGYAAYKDHLSFMVMSPPLMEKMAELLKPFKASTATLHFTPDKPLPEEVVRRIVEARIEEVLELVHAKEYLDPEIVKREIALTRTFDAPPEVVFKAWTSHEHLRHWFGPMGFDITTHEFNFKPGGVWRFIMHGPDGIDYPNKIEYQTITPNREITFLHSDDGANQQEPFETIVTFNRKGNKTELTLRNRLASEEEKNRLVKEFGVIEGGRQTLVRLGEYLKSLQG